MPELPDDFPTEKEAGLMTTDSTTEAPLSDAELGLIADALDSHEYWQLCEPEHRNSGYVMDVGVTPEIIEVRALADKIERMRSERKGSAIVRYRVPLYVHVDLDARTVSRVIIGDEETGLPEAVIEGGYPALAFEIAESAEWPAWEAGA